MTRPCMPFLYRRGLLQADDAGFVTSRARPASHPRATPRQLAFVAYCEPFIVDFGRGAEPNEHHDDGPFLPPLDQGVL